VRSGHHLLLSVVAGVALVPVVETGLPSVAVVGYAAALGTLVDLDHFLLARYNAGDWRTLRRGLAAPRLLTLRQGELIEPGEVGPFQRLGSHLVVAALWVGGVAWAGRPGLALVGAVVLYVHVLADVVWETRRRDPLD
jgi:hypothetical protein